MTLWIVLGALAVAGLLATAAVEWVARQLRTTDHCPPGCHCRGTAPRLRG